jgi:2-amino-4-hydroxy-6-hydroxymethyldihydropteridine diphosphokinase
VNRDVARPRARAGAASASGHAAYVALGANLGDAGATVRDAIAALDRLPATRVGAVSSLYRTAPHGVDDDQPDYVNAVVQVTTRLVPEALLQLLHRVERAHGRTRGARNAPRTLDLDLLLYDSRRFATPAVAVPHPRMHERAFVLRPLAEIAPDLSIPGRGDVRALLDRVAGQRVERCDDEAR